MATQHDVMRPLALDFGGTGYCVAISKGYSGYIHVDRMDWPKGYAFVIPCGDYEGGDTILPTLEYTVPLQPGQILGMLAGFLPHCCGQSKGPRYVLTLFTDKGIAKKTSDVLLEMGLKVSEINFDLNTPWLLRRVRPTPLSRPLSALPSRSPSVGHPNPVPSPSIVHADPVPSPKPVE
jgi:hypothetical protein